MIYTDRVHIIADTLPELHRFAKEVGLNSCWFDPDPSHPHYDFPKKGSSGYTREQLIQRAVGLGALVFDDKFKMWRARESNIAIQARTYSAIILNDYLNTPYATWIAEGKKKIETREGRLFSYRGDIVICCGRSNSIGPNAGLALCIVNIFDGRAMTKDDEEDACISWSPNRFSLLLKDWRHFSKPFIFSDYYISGPYQGIFKIQLPVDVEIIPRPDIKPHEDREKQLDLFSL